MKNTSSVFSLVIPVYNVDRYIRKCLDSLLSQDFVDWEAILVDDGSTDNSGKICDEYATLDSRFQVFHKINGGVSSARNMALNKARGEWVWFIDPDDWITHQALSTLYYTVSQNDCDMVLFGIEYFDEEGELIGMEKRTENLSGNKNLISKYCDYPPQNYLLKRDLIEKNALRFSVGVSTGEDLEFQYKYFMLCRQPISISNRLYCCLRREGSAMRNPNTMRNQARDAQVVLPHLVDFIAENHIEESDWMAARLNRTFKAVMSANYYIKDFRPTVNDCIRESHRKLRSIGYSKYLDTSIRIGLFDVRLYYLFQYLRNLIRK